MQHFERDASSDNLLLINSKSSTAGIRLNILYKETYPFTLSGRYTQTRPFQLDNQFEVNLGFDERGYKELLRDKILNAAKARFEYRQQELIKKYQDAFRQLQAQKNRLQSPATIQQTVQGRLAA